MSISDYTTKELNRFWSCINRHGSIPQHCPELGACWEWTACLVRGYGRPRLSKKHMFAHRVAWQLANGEIPDGLCVLHKCDNPKCCNPSHLFLGTHADNAHDRDNKKRGKVPDNRGENHPHHKLTWNDIHYIRNRWAIDGIKIINIAREMGLPRGYVSQIVNNKVWKE